jgi:hypothetical protein
MELNSRAILNWIDTTIPRGVDFITIFAAISLLFAAFKFFRQYKAHPQRKFAFYLLLFFLADGLDYLVFSLGGSKIMDDATATLLGMILDASVVATSLIFVFSKSDERTAQKDEKQDDNDTLHKH